MGSKENQQNVLAFIQARSPEPVRRCEIEQTLGLASSSLHIALGALVEAGDIVREKSKYRAAKAAPTAARKIKATLVVGQTVPPSATVYARSPFESQPYVIRVPPAQPNPAPSPFEVLDEVSQASAIVRAYLAARDNLNSNLLRWSAPTRSLVCALIAETPAQSNVPKTEPAPPEPPTAPVAPVTAPVALKRLPLKPGPLAMSQAPLVGSKSPVVPDSSKASPEPTRTEPAPKTVPKFKALYRGTYFEIRSGEVLFGCHHEFEDAKQAFKKSLAPARFTR